MVDQHKRVGDQDAYFSSIRRSWDQQLRKVFDELPNPQWSTREGAFAIASRASENSQVG